MQVQDPPTDHDLPQLRKAPSVPQQYVYPSIVSQNKKAAVLLIILQLAVIGVYAVFIRPQAVTPSSFGEPYQLASITPVVILALLAVPLSFALIKNAVWSNVGFAFLVVVLSLQLHPPIAGLLGMTDLHNFTSSSLTTSTNRFNLYASNANILNQQTQQITVTTALKCALANVVIFAALMGRTGPYHCVFVSFFGTVLYQVNRQLVSRWGMELGGSITIFLFGGITGGVVSMILLCKQGKAVDDHKMLIAGRMSLTVGGIGALLTWVCMPFLNTDIPSVLLYHHYAILNSLLAISACVLMTISLNCMAFGQIDYIDLIYSPLAGGAAVSTSAVLCATPMEAAVLGCASGIVHVLVRRTGIGCGCLLDNGVLMVVGMQGLLGGLASVGLAYYDGFHTRYSQLSTTVSSQPNGTTVIFDLPKYMDQLIAVGVSFGVSLVSGVIIGLILLCAASKRRSAHYHDEVYWSLQHSQISPASYGEVVRHIRVNQKSTSSERISRESSHLHAMVECEVSEGEDDLPEHVLL